jgi:hypothetical protein
VLMGRVGLDQVGLYYFIIFCPDLHPMQLNLDQKILIHTRSDLHKIINYLLIIFYNYN